MSFFDSWFSSKLFQESPSPVATWKKWVEFSLLVLILFVFAGRAAPGDNEAHYLCKAKHYWDATFCEGDFFLDTHDTHLVFYWTIGLCTTIFSLETTAWIGRILSWLLLAHAWQRLNRQMRFPAGLSVLTLGLFMGILSRYHMAGEWVIGGIEAKCFAYIFLLYGLEAILANRWKIAWPLLGIASAWHVVVGGWGAIAAFAVWGIAGRREISFPKMLPSLLLGGVFSLGGLLPAIEMSGGETAETLLTAYRIQVYERLPHHLLFSKMPSHHVLRQAVLVAIWGILTCLFFQGESKNISEEIRFKVKRLTLFTGATLGITFAGICIDKFLADRSWLEVNLLRFYWFRLSEVIVSMQVGLLMPIVAFLYGTKWPRAQRVAWGILLFTGVYVISGPVYENWRDPRPKSIAQGQGRIANDPKGYDRQISQAASWRATCQWIDNNIPNDSLILTPRHQQTFKWYAKRAEVVTYKDMPQDPTAVLEWKSRVQATLWCGPEGGAWHTLGDEKLRVLLKKYECDYFLLDKTRHDTIVPTTFKQIYPKKGKTENKDYALYLAIPDRFNMSR
ncbi:MAG: hypothetical protein MPJ24_03475 [Pirellulaceae bacterium]|nr:hypothetical protein [Pirellulaceae bacterium]